jgi:hypothetical protein
MSRGREVGKPEGSRCPERESSQNCPRSEAEWNSALDPAAGTGSPECRAEISPRSRVTISRQTEQVYRARQSANAFASCSSPIANFGCSRRAAGTDGHHASVSRSVAASGRKFNPDPIAFAFPIDIIP